GVLRPANRGGSGGSGTTRPPLRLDRVLLLLLLVQRTAGSRAAARRSRRERRAGLPVPHLLGQRAVDSKLGRSWPRCSVAADIRARLDETLRRRHRADAS